MKPAPKQRWQYTYANTASGAIIVQITSASSEAVGCLVVQIFGRGGGFQPGSTFCSPGLQELYNDKHNGDNAHWVYLEGQEAP